MEGLSVIGYFVWWSIRDLLVNKTIFNDLLSSNGLPPYSKKEDTVAANRSAFLKSVREVKISSSEFLIRKISKTAEKYTFGLVDESVNREGEQLGYQHSATMTYYPETGSLSCNAAHRAFDAVMEKYKKYQGSYNSDDIRDYLLEALKLHHRISVRSRGGIYFLPESSNKFIDSVEKLLEELPGDCELSIAPQIDMEQSKKSVYKAFVSELRGKISSFKEELANDSLKRKSAWTKRLEDFKELKKEVEFYQESLQFQVSDITKDLEDLSGDVRKKLFE